MGRAAARALSKHDLVIAGRKSGDVHADVTDESSVRAMFEKLGKVDAIVACTGNSYFGPVSTMTPQQFLDGMKDKVMGQINLALIGMAHVADGGSITLTSGVLAQVAMPGAAAISMVNAGLEGFARSAQLDLRRDLRINVVSPPWIKETMVKLGMDPTPGLAAASAANAYVAAVEGAHRGETLACAAFA